MKLQLLVICTAIAVGFSGCATNDPNRRAKTGAAVGAIAGAVLGHQLDDKSGRYVGAAVGAITGATVGNYMDKQQQAFDQALEQEQRDHEIEMERMQDDTLKLTLNNEVSFDFNSSVVKPAFRETLNKLSDLLIKYDRTVVHVVGHTDSVGSDAYNQQLSQRRAQGVADVLMIQGVPSGRIRTEGRGELEPRETNATEAGRQLNRRVEIYVKPIVEGREQGAYEAPQYR